MIVRKYTLFKHTSCLSACLSVCVCACVCVCVCVCVFVCVCVCVGVCLPGGVTSRPGAFGRGVGVRSGTAAAGRAWLLEVGAWLLEVGDWRGGVWVWWSA